MSRFQSIRLGHDLRARLTEELVRIIASTDSLEKMRALFHDLFSRTETVMFMRRIIAAELLLAGESYKTIGRELKMSQNTIKNIASVLSSGGSGYLQACGRLGHVRRDVNTEIRKAQAILENRGMARVKEIYRTYHLAETLLDEAQSSGYMLAAMKRKRGLK